MKLIFPYAYFFGDYDVLTALAFPFLCSIRPFEHSYL
jgi:hypothetical protein